MEYDGSTVTILWSSFWAIVIGIWVFKAMSSKSPPTTPKTKEKTRYVGYEYANIPCSRGFRRIEMKFPYSDCIRPYNFNYEFERPVNFE